MSNMMTAAVYHALDDIRIEQRPVPEIGPDDILLKTLACGLCGGETMAWYKKSEPKVLGHEPIGEVIEVGANVTDYKIGERLFVNHHVGRVQSHLSLRGRFTRDPFYSQMKLNPGGVCEYYAVTAQHLRMDVHRIPDSMTTAEAITIEPWSCVMGGLKHCNIQPGDTVAVVGAGFMGQGFVHMAPLFGAGKVIALDFSDWRLEKAREFGATHTINPKSTNAVAAMRDLNNGRLADTVIVIAPFASAWAQAEALVVKTGCAMATKPISTKLLSHRNTHPITRTRTAISASWMRVALMPRAPSPTISTSKIAARRSKCWSRPKNHSRSWSIPTENRRVHKC
jgi:L-iditol 2-dehydrogenase